MANRHFDFVVIGGGSAGYAAARTARETMENVAIIDDATELGGLCILRGCMPSKTLIYSAEVLHLAQRGKDFGLEIREATVDMSALHRRKIALTEDFASYRRGQLESDRFHLIRDQAAFEDERTVILKKSGDRITANYFMIATGSIVNTPDIPGLRDAPCWTSDDVLDLTEIPESVIVLGGGIVACELAQFLRRIGSRVTQIQRSARILKDGSPEASAVVSQAFRDEGIELCTDTRIDGVFADSDGVLVRFVHQGKSREVRAAHLFNALGRKANTASLELVRAKIDTNSDGQICVNDMQQTSCPHIYAAGDVTGPYEIVHLAILQAEVAARHARGESPAPINYDLRTEVVFTDPQIASVGVSIGEAKERKLDLIVAEYPFDDHGKSMLMEARYGYVKVWADRATDRLVGAECVGKDAGELIHSMAVAITLGARPIDLLKVQWYHPTLSEIWSYPLEELVDELKIV